LFATVDIGSSSHPDKAIVHRPRTQGIQKEKVSSNEALSLHYSDKEKIGLSNRYQYPQRDKLLPTKKKRREYDEKDIRV